MRDICHKVQSIARQARGIPIVLSIALMLGACAKSEDRAEQNYRKGLELIAKGDDLSARLELLNAIKYKGDKIEAWRALAGVNERTGADRELYRNLQQIINLDPSDDNTKVRLARFMIRSGGADAALKVLDSVSRHDGEFHGIKATALASVKDLAGALQEANKATELDPSNPDAALILASDRMGRNDAAGALRLLEKAKVDDPKDTRISVARAEVLGRTGKFADAESELRAAVGQQPKDARLRTQLFQILARQRKMEEAEKELRALADISPSDSKVGIDLMRFIFGSKGAAAARQELETRVKLGGDVLAYQFALVDLDVREKKMGEATRRLEALIADGKTSSDKDAARVKLAELKIAQKEIASADKIISEVLAADRRNAGALRLRAVNKLNKGEVDSAVADLREALNEQPRAPELLILLAQAYERGGRHELAERQYADAMRSSEYNPAVVLKYAAYLQHVNSLPRAEDVLVEALRRNPQSVDIVATLAQVRLARSNWRGALQIADALAANESTKVTAEQIRAAALSGENKPEESLAALESAHLAAPNAVAPVIALSRMYAALKKYDKAEELLRDMDRKRPESAQPLIVLGQVYLVKGALAEAQKSFEMAVARAPSDPSSHDSLANFYLRQRNLKDALTTVEVGLKNLPGNVGLRTTRASVLEALSDHEAAIAEYEGILKDDPGSLIAVNNVASMLLDYRTDKASLDRAQAMVERLRGAKGPQFADTIGWALHLRGDHMAALPLLEQAKSQLPSNATIRFHLGILYRSLGEEAKAVEELKAAALLVTNDGTLKDKIQAALN
jgi:tetratricopeptide (TPR) repeat protein